MSYHSVCKADLVVGQKHLTRIELSKYMLKGRTNTVTVCLIGCTPIEKHCGGMCD